MNEIPIVFTFDDNYAVPAAVAIKSLIHASNPDTWYEIYCLYNNLSEKNRRRLDKIAKINWIKIGENVFHNAPATDEYPLDVYYRLIIHDILPSYNKIIYSDVDVLFHEDLSDIYNTNIDNFYWAGVPFEKNEVTAEDILKAQTGNPDDVTYMSGHTKFQENKNEYIFSSGFMLINTKKMREDQMTKKFLRVIDQFSGRLKMFDLDVLNLACQNNTILPISFRYCVLEDIAIAKDFKKTNLYPFLTRVFSDKELIQAILNPVISHYTGADPIRVWNRDGKAQPVSYKILFDMIPEGIAKQSSYPEQLQFSDSDRILVLAPHPDDESIGCAGVLMNYAQQCDVVVLTDGRHGGESKKSDEDVIALRKFEFENVMQEVGVKSYKFFDIEDGKLSENFERFSEIQFDQYDVIVCPAPTERHVDHACVYKFLLKCEPNARIFTYEVWSTLVNPTHYIDISHSIEEKKKLISYYKSQLSQVDYISKITGLNCYRGMQIYPAIPYAEMYQEM